VEATNGVATISDPVTGTRLELNPSTKSARRASAGLEFGIARVANPSATKAGTPETTENLKPQMVNGVMAQGVRITMTIPKGQIGNNRVIKVITERWVSSDLQIPIKTTNSDPRFGDTTYQLTGIVQQEPDTALFQIPRRLHGDPAWRARRSESRAANRQEKQKRAGEVRCRAVEAAAVQTEVNNKMKLERDFSYRWYTLNA
jgi:hypothetical protein